MKNILAALASIVVAPSAPAFALSLDMKWDPGAEVCAPGDDRMQVHAIDQDTIVIRQNPCLDPEANLLYLLTGESRALLIDTGAVETLNGRSVAELVSGYLQRPGAVPLTLFVAHTHGHLDHRLGDAQFTQMPGVEIVPVESAALRQYYGFTNWPDGIARIDLGGRVVDVIPTPGHHEDHVVFYDVRTRLLFTGDFLLPGRLLVDDLGAYRASARRIVDFVKQHPVSYVLGAHVELDTGGNPYPGGATYHPDERALAMSAADVAALPAALDGFNGFYSRHPNFIVVNPMHNLVALATGALVALVLVVWIARRLWKRRER